MTLLSPAVARKHEVPFDAVAAVAREHVELDGGEHFFRFYERPEDWRSTRDVDHLCSSIPGVFDIEKIRPSVVAAKNLLELNLILRNWK